MGCDVPHWLGEQTTIYKGVETFPQQKRFKTLRGSPKGKAQRGQYLHGSGPLHEISKSTPHIGEGNECQIGQYLLAVGLCCYNFGNIVRNLVRGKVFSSKIQVTSFDNID